MRQSRKRERRIVSVTGTNGKSWENAGISGKNWEQLGDSDRKVGNSGNSWDNWIVPWRTCRTGDSKFLLPTLGEMRRPAVPRPVTIGDFEHRKPSHGRPNHLSRPSPVFGASAIRCSACMGLWQVKRASVQECRTWRGKPSVAKELSRNAFGGY